jgi:hypothetical protein
LALAANAPVAIRQVDFGIPQRRFCGLQRELMIVVVARHDGFAGLQARRGDADDREDDQEDERDVKHCSPLAGAYGPTGRTSHLGLLLPAQLTASRRLMVA